MPNWLATLLKIVLAAALPLCLVLTNVRLIMSNAYLHWEYNLADFPPDLFGFTKEDRLAYAPTALAYLFNDQGIEFLGDQKFPDGRRMYNDRELKHMADVKGVTRGAMAVWAASIVLVVGSIAALGWRPETRPMLRSGLLIGSAITVGALLLLVLYIALNFDVFFVQFHKIFFEGNTWLFDYSDTLIRLFPVKFWSDAFTIIGGAALLEGIVIGALAWWGLRAGQ